jgi:diguanylate cyclase (GGDEF)-like protein/PAS domain S-box-containing protein
MSILGPRLADHNLRTRLDGFVLETVQAFLPGLATLYVITGALRLTLWHSQPVETAVLTVMAVVSAGIHLRLRAEIRNGRIRLEQAHPLAAGIAGVALLNALLHLFLIPEPEGATVVILIALASACVLLDTRWLAAVLAMALAGWALAAVMAPPDVGWLHFGVALIVSAILAFAVLTIRLRTYRELHAEHLAEVRAIRERYLGERETVDSDVAGKTSVLQARGEMDGLWDWDLTTDRLYFSPRWKSMLGYSDRDLDLSSEDWLNLIHFHDLHIVTERLWAHLYGKAENFEAEHRIQQANGDYRWVLTRGSAIRNEAGECDRMVGSMVDIKLLKNFEERLLHDASHDRLTGLPNREYLFERIRAELQRQQGNEHYLFAVIFLDLDRFKDVNDSLGHLVGDQLLANVARRLEEEIRDRDIVARVGGDEFVVLLRGLWDQAQALTIASRIRTALSSTFQIERHEISAAASLGIALSGAGIRDPEELLRNADIAMYKAKARSKGGIQVFDSDMHVRAARRWSLQNELRRAVEDGQLELRYQPIVRLGSGRISGAEALVRWRRSQDELVGPAEFIPIAEEIGLIADVGGWALKEACRQNKEWQNAGWRSVKMSVNVSARQLSRPEFVRSVRKILEETQLDPRWLQLEITESALIGTLDGTPESLDGLSLLEIPLALDDFGTGYSSLSYLRRLPVRALKIDRSFIADITNDGTAATLAESIISMAHGLRLNVIAEGIETESQLRRLQSYRCDEIQGYLISRPVTADEFTAMLRQDDYLLGASVGEKALTL